MADAKAKKKGFNVGDRVKFFRLHDKQTALVGTIEKFHEDSDLVDIKAEVDGKKVEVERTESAHLDDVSAA